MKKRTAIIIIIAVLLVGTALLYFLLGGKAPSGLPIFDGSPFGTPPDDTGTVPPGGEPTIPGVDSDGRPLPRFIRLSDAPIAGAMSLIKNGSTYIRYVDRATGHIYDINPTTLERGKVYNTTTPRVYAALWRPDALGFVSRTLAERDEVVANTAILLVPPQSTSTDSLFRTQASLLRGTLGDVAVLPNGNLIYIEEETGSLTSSSFMGDKTTTVFSRPFVEWRLKPISNSSAIIYTKPSESALGFAYRVDLGSGRLNKILGPLSALSVTPSVDGRRLAYSYISNQGYKLNATSVDGVSVEIIPTTVADKCVWSKKDPGLVYCAVPENGLGAGAPDAWYQGLASYSDRVWRFNADTNTAEILVDPKRNFDIEVDAFDLLLSPDEDYLFFTSKSDLSLWGLRLR